MEEEINRLIREINEIKEKNNLELENEKEINKNVKLFFK
jgi:hypothetical protein